MGSKSAARVAALGVVVGLGSALLLSGPAVAGCFVPPAKLPDSSMQVFRDRPQDLLDRHPSGGPMLSSEVVRYVGSDEMVLASVIELARVGNRAQRVAIGIGLARAVSVCSRAFPELERLVAKAVAASGISELATAVAAGLNSIPGFAGDEQVQTDEASLTSASPAAGGGGSRAGVGGGSNSSVGAALLTLSLRGSATSARRGGRPIMSTRGAPTDDNTEEGGNGLRETVTGTAPAPQVPPRGGEPVPAFSSKGVTSTYGATVSPTR